MMPKDLLHHLWADMERQSSSVYMNRGRRRDLTFSLMVFSYLMALFLILLENKLNANMSCVILSKVVSFIRLDFTRVPFLYSSKDSFYFKRAWGFEIYYWGQLMLLYKYLFATSRLSASFPLGEIEAYYYLESALLTFQICFFSRVLFRLEPMRCSNKSDNLLFVYFSL